MAFHNVTFIGKTANWQDVENMKTNHWIKMQ